VSCVKTSGQIAAIHTSYDVFLRARICLLKSRWLHP